MSFLNFIYSTTLKHQNVYTSHEQEAHWDGMAGARTGCACELGWGIRFANEVEVCFSRNFLSLATVVFSFLFDN